LGGPVFWPARERLPVLVPIAALALTRLAALATLTLILATAGPLTVGRGAAEALLAALIAVALTLTLPLILTSSLLTLILIALVVCHGTLLQWRPGHRGSL
jgi:hypothetical protein